MSEKLGIELWKDLATDVVGAFKKYQEAKEDDGQVTKFEWIGLAPSIGKVIKDLLAYPKLIKELRDIDSVERKELLDHIVSLDVVGDKAEIVLVNLLEAVEAEVVIYHKNIVPIINVFKK